MTGEQPRRFPIADQGYERAEVDRHITDLAARIEVLSGERDRLEAEVVRLRAELDDATAPSPAVEDRERALDWLLTQAAVAIGRPDEPSPRPAGPREASSAESHPEPAKPDPEPAKPDPEPVESDAEAGQELSEQPVPDGPRTADQDAESTSELRVGDVSAQSVGSAYDADDLADLWDSQDVGGSGEPSSDAREGLLGSSDRDSPADPLEESSDPLGEDDNR